MAGKRAITTKTQISTELEKEAWLKITSHEVKLFLKSESCSVPPSVCCYIRTNEGRDPSGGRLPKMVRITDSRAEMRQEAAEAPPDTLQHPKFKTSDYLCTDTPRVGLSAD